MIPAVDILWHNQMLIVCWLSLTSCFPPPQPFSVVTGATCLLVVCALRSPTRWYTCCPHNTGLSSGILHNDSYFFYLHFFCLDFPRRFSVAGRCPVNNIGSQWQCIWTRWGEGHWEITEELCLLHIAGITSQQLWHGHRGWKGTVCRDVPLSANTHSGHYNIFIFQSNLTCFSVLNIWLRRVIRL